RKGETMADTTSKIDLNDSDVHEECVRRIEALGPDAAPEWGEMNVAQMLAHCVEVQKVMNDGPLEGTPWYLRLAAPLVKRLVLSGGAFPKNVATHPQYDVGPDRDFETEKRRLLDTLAAFRDRGRAGIDHPIFGRMTPEETGWVAYKHLDHHLRQFGV
ncbi:MAG: DUF1569 domain-containing protein, partial [Gemmatimonadota bacterium]